METCEVYIRIVYGYITSFLTKPVSLAQKKQRQNLRFERMFAVRLLTLYYI